MLRNALIENCVGSPLLTWIIVFPAWLFTDWWCGAVFCGDAERQFVLVPLCCFYSLCLFYSCLMIDEGTLFFVLWCPKANCACLPLWILSHFAFIGVHWQKMKCSICVLWCSNTNILPYFKSINQWNIVQLKTTCILYTYGFTQIKFWCSNMSLWIR